MSDVTEVVDRLVQAEPFSAAADFVRKEIATAGLILDVKRELQSRARDLRYDKVRLLPTVQHLLLVGRR